MTWSDCMEKWLSAGAGYEEAMKIADSWEAKHREIDRAEEVAIARYKPSDGRNDVT